MMVDDIISGKRRLKNSDTLKDVYRKKERKRMQDMLNLTEGDVINEFAESGRTRQTMPPRRRMLLEALCAKPEMAANVDLAVSATNHETCVECLDCTKSCPTGARTISAENGSLSYDARHPRAAESAWIRAPRTRSTSWKPILLICCRKDRGRPPSNRPSHRRNA